MEKEFIELINKHIGIIRKVCNIYFYNNPNSEDYQQEMLMRLWKAFPGFNHQSKFSTWMYRVAVNTAIDIVRKQSIRPAYISLTKDEFSLSFKAEDHELGEKEKFYRAVNRLKDSEKAIILLYLEDYSYKEISEIIGISESNVGVKINRIKKQLIKIINIHEEG